MSWKRANPEQRMLPLIEIIPRTETGIWLDAGSGDGLFARILESHLSKTNVLKIDKNRYTDLSQNGLMSYAEQIPFRRDCFDGIVLGQLLHYIPYEDQISLINRMTMLLRSEGLILIVEYSIPSSYSWIPYPIQLTQFKKKVLGYTGLTYVSEKHIPDGRRPKFSLLFRKPDTE